MSLTARIKSDMYASTNAGDEAITDGLKMALRVIEDREKKLGKKLDDQDVHGVVRASVKMCGEMYLKLMKDGRESTAYPWLAKVVYLMGNYLPPEMQKEHGLGPLGDALITQMAATRR